MLPLRRITCFRWLWLLAIGWFSVPNPLPAQSPTVVRQFELSGTVRSIQPGRLSVLAEDGETWELKIQNQGEEALMIAGAPVRFPAMIRVWGMLPIGLVERGMIVEFEGMLNEYGKAEGTVSKFKLAAEDQEIRLEFLRRPEKGDFAPVSVVGRVASYAGKKVTLQVPKARWARQERVAFNTDDDSQLLVLVHHLNPVIAGDRVVKANVVELSSGDLLVRSIDVQLTAAREQYTRSFHERLEQQFRHLSDEPVTAARRLVSDHFVLYTDIPERQAQILLAKLENMYGLISSYFGKRPATAIECYVVADPDRWTGGSLHPTGLSKIREGTGVTVSVRDPTTRQTHSVVYSTDRHGVCQHEAVHAFCAMAFGSVGPVWYAEGMAELGQYWQPEELAVNIDPVVIEYLRQAKPKGLMEIVNSKQITGDSWEAYAWRWALCHLLVNNRNYSRRFKTLGLALMTEQADSFENAFGRVVDQLSFEYQHFIQHVGNGYRVDLCMWNWNVKPGLVSGGQRIRADVKAAAGWQPSKARLQEGVAYDVVAQGEWWTSTVGGAVDAGGDTSGRGKLVGMVLNDFQIHGPFELGVRSQFVAPADGQLYLRCQDEWTELADNRGEITVFLKRAREEE
jgi:hypothetical protein